MDLATLQIKLMESEERIYNYVTGRIPDNFRAVIGVDDVLQEIWTSAFQNAAELHEDSPNAFDRWIITIARNKVTDAIRHATAKRRGDLNGHFDPFLSSYLTLVDRVAGDLPTPSSEMSTHESIRAVRHALGRLPADYRQAIMLHHIEGRSHEEIAKIMDRTVNAVNGLMFRALRRLRSEMGRASKYFTDTDDTTMSNDPDEPNSPQPPAEPEAPKDPPGADPDPEGET